MQGGLNYVILICLYYVCHIKLSVTKRIGDHIATLITTHVSYVFKLNIMHFVQLIFIATGDLR
jgi:hypothetical protein